jgi:pSer/pThr/pTyr-binding forkhead associated (FHA) protein
MQFKLFVVRGQQRGTYLVFPSGEFVIGRGKECQIRTSSDLVSRQHCLLRVTRELGYVRDLGSTNGTLVNGVRVVGELKLHDADRLQVGQLEFEVRFEQSIIVSKTTSTELADHPGEQSKPDGTTAETPAFTASVPITTQSPPGSTGGRSQWPTPPPMPAHGSGS